MVKDSSVVDLYKSEQREQRNQEKSVIKEYELGYGRQAGGRRVPKLAFDDAHHAVLWVIKIKVK
jgi:hypothetical protein